MGTPRPRPLTPRSDLCVAIFEADSTGRVMDWSAGAERLFATPARGAVGRIAETFFESLGPRTPLDVFRLVRACGRVHENMRGRRLDGATFEADVTISTIRRRDDSPLSFLVVVIPSNLAGEGANSFVALAEAMARLDGIARTVGAICELPLDNADRQRLLDLAERVTDLRVRLAKRSGVEP